MKSTLCLTLCLPGLVSAADINWNGSVSNDWNNTANWDGGVIPGAADNANVVTLTNPPVVPGGTVLNELWAGGPGGSGVGRFDITSGTVTANGWTAVGRDATGFASITNANLNGRLVVGGFVNGRGTFDIGAGATVTNANNFWVVGEQAGAQGRINQTDGTVNINGGFEARIGQAAGAYGNYVMSGGSLNANTTLQIGGTGTGVFRQSGGTVTHAANTWAAVGRFAGSRGELTITGGDHNHDLAGASTSHHFIIAENGAGVVNLSGAGTLSTGRDILIGNAGGSGTLNLLSGGTATADRVRDMNGNAADGSSRVNFNGGTLKAGAGTAVTDFLQGLTSATVYSGGAKIDTNGTDVTVGQALLAPAGDGISSIPVANGGVGYLGAPYVEITGGGGEGATAIADIDANGTITGFTITNPGTGYTSAPTINLVGGEPANAATLGAVTTAANVSGGLTKTGAGTLTLNGVSTYSGQTIITQGTLKLGAGGSLSPSSVVNVAAGANFDGSASGVIIPVGQTLKGNGTTTGDTTVNGTIAPGNSIGALTIAGNLTLSGTTDMEIDPSVSPNSDEIIVISPGTTITYGGTLNVTQIGGTLALGDTFDMFDAATFSGSFTTTNLPSLTGLGDGFWYWKNDLSTLGSITVLPEPGSTGLFGLAALAALGRRRRK